MLWTSAHSGPLPTSPIMVTSGFKKPKWRWPKCWTCTQSDILPLLHLHLTDNYWLPLSCCWFAAREESLKRVRESSFLRSYLLRSPWLMSWAHPFEQSVTDGHREVEREHAHGQCGTQWGTVLIFSYTDRSSLERLPKAKGEIKLESYTCWHPFAFKCVWPPRQQGPGSSDGLAVITPNYKYLFGLFLSIPRLPIHEKEDSC